MAAALVQNGGKVYIASRKLDVVEQAAKELNQMGPGSCIAIQADLTSKDQAQRLVKKLETLETKLHILVNNAGMSWGNDFFEFDEKNGWDRLFALNVKGIFYLTVA